MLDLPSSKDVEWMLKNYESNRKRIAERMNEILALSHKSRFEGHASSNTGRHGSPVESMVIRFESDRELRFLKSQVLPVEYFLQTSATDIDKKLLQLRYFHQGSRTWEETATLMGFSAIYVRSKCRTGLLKRAAVAFLEWEDKNTKTK